jgi:hypothetical protein
MRKRSSRNVNEMAFAVTQTAAKARKQRKNPAAVSLGKLGGKKGGPARAAALSPERRKEIARKAAEKRWTVQQSDSH